MGGEDGGDGNSVHICLCYRIGTMGTSDTRALGAPTHEQYRSNKEFTGTRTGLNLSKAVCVPCVVSKNPKRARRDKATFCPGSPSP